MKRIGIVGAGSIARTHADRIKKMPGIELAGYYDIFPEASQRAVEQYGGKVYPSLDALLDDVNYVDICTTANAHKEPVLAALEAGVPACVEKPLARHLADCYEIVEAQARTGTPLFVAQVVRYFPQFAAAKAALDRGDIGAPGVIRTVRGGSAPGGGGWGSASSARSYYNDFDKSGGVILDVSIHDIDYQRWCFGEVERVFARGLRFTGKNPKDHALISLRFENGAIGHIEGSWAYPPGLWRTRIEMAGTAGLLEWDSLDQQPVEWRIQPEGESAPSSGTASPLVDTDDPYYRELAHFIDAVENDKPQGVTAYDGLMAVKISLAAIESQRRGEAVRVQDYEEKL